MKKLGIILFTIFLLCPCFLFAQNDGEPLTFGEHKKVYSRILNEERSIFISLPFGYERGRKEYPVLYITDGESYNFLRASGLVRYFARGGFPAMITVGIPNTKRSRDLAPAPMEFLEESGGGGDFLKFIGEELIPFIDKNYRTTDYRILYGASAGGDFTIYSLFTKPEYFSAYIASSPPLGFADGFTLKQAEKFLKSNRTLNKYLYIIYGAKDFSAAVYYIPKLIQLFEAEAPRGFKWKLEDIEEEGHVPFESLYKGLLSVFNNWSSISTPEIIPSGGEIRQGKSLSVSLSSNSGEIRYTQDGEEPTRRSELFKEDIKISSPAVIKAKVFRGNLGESNTTTAEFKSASIFRAVDNPGNLRQGLKYKYFEKRLFYFNETINLDSFNPGKAGIAENFDLDLSDREDGFIIQFDGCISIPSEGQYTFYLFSNGLSRLYLDNRLFIHKPGITEAKERSYSAYLEAGMHSIKVIYTNPWAVGKYLKVKYDGPGIKKQEIPSSILYFR
ncbi:alpha/beta hydrolase-fold protein [candidate division KSB1 bacterium]